MTDDIGYLTPSPEMIVDTVDIHDQQLGTIPRNRVLPTGHDFRVAHLLLFSQRGDILLQQLARTRERHPLAWGSSVASYLFAGEDYEEAIRRRCVQELGRCPDRLRYLGKTVMKDQHSWKFIGVFTGIGEGPFTIDRQHIEQVEFVPIEQLRAELRVGVRVFTPTFRHVFAAAAPLLAN